MIERVTMAASESDVRALAQLLSEAVDSGAAVSFLTPLTLERAEAWWGRVILASEPGAVVLAARDGEGIVGSVQLHPAWAPQPLSPLPRC